jgi:hypothetical protein
MRVLMRGLITLPFTAGLGTGLVAIIRDTPPLWRTADLFFDLALLIMMLSRGRALVRNA